MANDPPVNLAKIDCTEAGKDTCNRFEVRGYPTLKIFRGGEVSQDYNGPRDAGGIVKYMKSQVSSFCALGSIKMELVNIRFLEQTDVPCPK